MTQNTNTLLSWMAAPNPGDILRNHRANGWLKEHLPEVDALYGIPQSAMWHPEVDTGHHIELCMDRVAELTTDLDIRFSVLVHDLGKGITPVEILPKHHGHEKAGLPLVEAVCARFEVPFQWRELALINCEHHINIHRIVDLRPGTLVSMLADTGIGDSLRLADSLGIACQADKQGRLGLEHQPYPQRELLISVAKAYKQGVLKGQSHQELCGTVSEVMKAHAYHVEIQDTSQFMHRASA